MDGMRRVGSSLYVMVGAIAIVAIACTPHAFPNAASPAAGASSSHAQSEPAHVDVVVVPPAADADAGVDDVPEGRARAEAAVGFVAQRLFDIEAQCRDEWKSADVCDDKTLDAAAADYQEIWFHRDDPHRTEGRIDALPRLGGRNVETSVVETRVRAMCEQRCDIARYLAIGEATHFAQEACIAKKSHAPCAALAKRVARTAPNEVEKWTAVCEEECDEKRARLRYVEEIERKRPRTEAQSRACNDECLRKCNGGRPRGERDPDDWCGTCEFTCSVNCAVKGAPITLP
jgi:hypothetical protein